jgi:predicted nucleic acid-binding protein
LRYILDSYAWLEYFMGTQAGARVKEIVDSEADEKLTPSICLAEIYAKILRTEDEQKAELRRAFIKSRSGLIPLTEELAVEAAKTDVAMKKKVHGWGLADSVVLSTARNRNGKVATGDPHFRGLKESYMIS